MKNRIIINNAENVAENLKNGFSYAFTKALQENKAISLVAITRNVLKQNLNSAFGEDFLKGIESTGKIKIENKIFNINIITQKNLNKTEPNEIALYVYPTSKLLTMMENKRRYNR